MKVEFEHAGRTFLYAPEDDRCGSVRFMRAQAVWTFQQQIMTNPPPTWREFAHTGAADADLRGLACLMMECDAAGKVIPYEKDESDARALAFLESLPARHSKTLKEVRLDFFARAGLFNIESLKLLSEVYAASKRGEVVAAALSSELTETPSETESLDSSESENNAGSPASSTDDSTEVTPPPPTTGTDSPSS